MVLGVKVSVRADRRRAALAGCLMVTTALGGWAMPVVALAQSQPGQAATPSFNVRAQSLNDALTDFGQQSGLQVSVDSAAIRGVSSPGVTGSMPAVRALSQLLAGTGFTFRISGDVVTLERAPQSAQAIQLGPVRVEGGEPGSTGRRLGAALSPATSERSKSYAARAATIGKDEQALKDIPQSISVLTRRSMDDQNIISLDQAFLAVPGVTIAKSPGTGYFVFSRGFTIDTLQYDGVSLFRNGYSAGSYMAESMVFYDRMEVLRGAAGLLQGAAAPGGAVNLVRKRGQEARTVSAMVLAGSWDHYAGQIDAGGPVDKAGALRVRGIIDYDQSDSFTDLVWSKTRSLYLAADYDIDPDTTIGLGVSNRRMRGRPFERGLPRYAGGGDLGLPRSTFAGAEWNRTANDQTVLFADVEHRFGGQWTAKATAIHYDEHSRATYQFLSGAIDPKTLSGAAYSDFATDFNIKGNAGDAHLNGKFSALGMDHELILGASYFSHRTNDTIARQFGAAPADVFDINHDRPRRTLSELIATQFSQRSWFDVEQSGLYGVWRAKPVEALTIVLGGRLNWYDYSYRTKRGNQAVYGAVGETVSKASGKFTPYAGMVYRLANDWNAYASYATIYEPQSTRDASGSLLKPVEGANYEAGVKGEVMDGRANVSIALFRYDHRNRSVYDYTGGYACDGWYCSVATGKVRSQGVELEISGEILPNLQIYSGYTYNTTKLLNDPLYQGQRFSTWAPKHMLRLWANYALPGDLDRISAGVGADIQSGTLSSDRSFDLPGFSVWKARLGYKLKESLSLGVNVNNLFDKRYYIPSYSSPSGNNVYGDPRNITVTLRGTL